MASICSRALKDGSTAYQVIVSITGFPRLAKTFPTRAEAKAFGETVEKDLRAQIKSRSPVAKTPPKPAPSLADFNRERIADLLDIWKNTSECTKSNRGNCPSVVRQVGQSRVEEIDEYWIMDYIERLSKTKSKFGRVFSMSTIRRHLLMIAMALRARARTLRLPKPEFPFSDRMLGPNWSKSRKRTFGIGEKEALFKRFDAIGADVPSRNHWPLLIRLALLTAARLQELVLAEWSELSDSGKSWNIPAEHCKTRSDRSVPLNFEARSVIAQLQALRDHSKPRIFHALGTPASVSVLFHKYAGEAGLVNFRFHDLRHVAITHLYKNEKSLSERNLMLVVGHSSFKQVIAYTHLRADDLSDAMDADLLKRNNQHDAMQAIRDLRRERVRKLRELHLPVRMHRSDVALLDALCQSFNTSRSQVLKQCLPRVLTLLAAEATALATASSLSMPGHIGAASAHPTDFTGWESIKSLILTMPEATRNGLVSAERATTALT